MSLVLRQACWLAFFLLVCATPSLAAMAKNLDAAKARTLIDSNQALYILDVRTPQEYAEVRLSNSQLIPIDTLLKRIGELPKDRPILVYCAVGSRSSQVANYLARAGYPEIYNLYGGIWAWQLRGYPVEKGLP